MKTCSNNGIFLLYWKFTICSTTVIANYTLFLYDYNARDFVFQITFILNEMDSSQGREQSVPLNDLEACHINKLDPFR